MSDNQLTEAVAELRAASLALDEQRMRTAEARSRECDAINRVNAAQKRIDALMTDLKRGAARDTDWKRPSISTGSSTVKVPHE